MDDVEIHSTPKSIKKADDHDMMNMMLLLLEKNTMCTKFNEQI